MIKKFVIAVAIPNVVLINVVVLQPCSSKAIKPR